MTQLRKTKKTPAWRALGALVALALTMLPWVTGCSTSGAEQRRGSIYDWQRDPTPENLVLIREHLTDPDRDVRATALNVLVGLGEPDAEALARDGLQDPDGFVRSIAAKLLGDLKLVEASDVLVTQMLEDAVPRARQTAAEALTVLGGEEALSGLMQALVDPMSEVRLAAVRGVRALGPVRGKAAMARMVLNDPDWEVRVQAAGGLGAAQDPEMVPILERAFAEDPSDFVRSAAANALRALGEDIPLPEGATAGDEIGSGSPAVP